METIITLQDSLDTPTFYGVNNCNILCLKNQHPDVRVVARGYQVKVTGSEKAVEQFERSLRLCEQFCIRNNRLAEQEILMLLHGDKPQEQATDNLILHGVNGKSIYARSENQQALVRAYEENDLLFAVGPAGSGKTYTAIALAVRALKNKEVRRIILSRPAVGRGETWFPPRRYEGENRPVSPAALRRAAGHDPRCQTDGVYGERYHPNSSPCFHARSYPLGCCSHSRRGTEYDCLAAQDVPHPTRFGRKNDCHR